MKARAHGVDPFEGLLRGTQGLPILAITRCQPAFLTVADLVDPVDLGRHERMGDHIAGQESLAPAHVPLAAHSRHRRYTDRGSFYGKEIVRSCDQSLAIDMIGFRLDVPEG